MNNFQGNLENSFPINQFGKQLNYFYQTHYSDLIFSKKNNQDLEIESKQIGGSKKNSTKKKKHQSKRSIRNKK